MSKPVWAAMTPLACSMTVLAARARRVIRARSPAGGRPALDDGEGSDVGESLHGPLFVAVDAARHGEEDVDGADDVLVPVQRAGHGGEEARGDCPGAERRASGR